MGGKSATTFTNVDLKNVVLGVTTFIRIFGDSLVPKLFVVPGANDLHASEWPSEIHGMKLGGWVQDIRRAYKRKQLSQEFIDALQIIDFAWSHKEYLLEGIHLPAIRKYRQVYNTLDIPIPFIIPSNEPWERKTWGLKLGRIFASLKAKYHDHVTDLIDGNIKVSEDGILSTISEHQHSPSTEMEHSTPYSPTKQQEIEDIQAIIASPQPLPLNNTTHIHSSDRYAKKNYNKELKTRIYPEENGTPTTISGIATSSMDKLNNNEMTLRHTTSSSDTHLAIINVLKSKNKDLNGKLSTQAVQMEALKAENKTLRLRLGVLRQEMHSTSKNLTNRTDVDEILKMNAALEEHNKKLIDINEQIQTECSGIEGNEDIKSRISALQDISHLSVPEKSSQRRAEILAAKSIDDVEIASLRAHILALEKDKQHLGKELSRHKFMMSRKRRKLENMSQIVASTFRAVFEDMNDDDI